MQHRLLENLQLFSLAPCPLAPACVYLLIQTKIFFKGFKVHVLCASCLQVIAVPAELGRSEDLMHASCPLAQ